MPGIYCSLHDSLLKKKKKGDTIVLPVYRSIEDSYTYMRIPFTKALCTFMQLRPELQFGLDLFLSSIYLTWHLAQPFKFVRRNKIAYPDDWHPTASQQGEHTHS